MAVVVVVLLAAVTVHLLSDEIALAATKAVKALKAAKVSAALATAIGADGAAAVVTKNDLRRLQPILLPIFQEVRTRLDEVVNVPLHLLEMSRDGCRASLLCQHLLFRSRNSHKQTRKKANKKE